MAKAAGKEGIGEIRKVEQVKGEGQRAKEREQMAKGEGEKTNRKGEGGREKRKGSRGKEIESAK
jgi:hypothetical protein